ncbi:hypothetical protein GCM10011390_50430 [Aureimonas endophytica]|uniref:Uncharacterized protein n=2 Tax=Aureimonas endophytica TaxID=2027858 RepID=A0A917A4M7_9HYPH|nr:hypothetical protein GCM10011390_50430 [Aureimonas endophytica]
MDPIGLIVGETPEPTLIGYGIAAELVASWVLARPGVVSFYSLLGRYSTMNSAGSGRPDAECEAHLAEIAGQPDGDGADAILHRYDKLIDHATELTHCGFGDHGIETAQWLENHLAIGGLYVLSVCDRAGVPRDAAHLMADLFRDIMRERAETIVATMHDAPQRLQ